MKKKHIIKNVIKDSVAWEKGIASGDFLLSINDEPVEDIFDYQFLCQDELLKIVIESPIGDIREIQIEKDEDEDLGLEFDEGLMDEYHSCCNKCIFCFIDQMPKGMRETLYFKDDDMRLSFLQGNYVTLTNLSDRDIDRIIKYRLEPVNISFQTTNPELRCMMLHNRFAGEALKKADRLFEAGITMNGQIVLCKGINDGAELERSISDLYKYLPLIESVSVVPVGLSKYRDGLYPLEPFNKDDAIKVIETIEKWQQKAFAEFGTHFVHASDEWYITAEMELPSEESYDGYLQIENGVGMLRNMLTEYQDGMDILNNALQYKPSLFDRLKTNKVSEMLGVKTPFEIKNQLKKSRKVHMVTGLIASKYIKKMADEFMEKFPSFDITVCPIRNDFFGEMITVTGLLTGQDIIAQLKDQKIENLLLPENLFKSGTTILLDDLDITDIEKSLHCKASIVKLNGMYFIESIVGEDVYV